MITFKQFMLEMAAPSAQHLEKTYYHGTSSKAAFDGIMKNGIQPGSLVAPEKFKPSKAPNLNPVHGKVYITPDIGYAQIYAIAGDLAGSNVYNNREDEYGYVFVIDGKELSDIEPDEDSIGEMIYQQLKDPKDPPGSLLSRYLWITREKLTQGQFKKFSDGEYVMYAHLGKKLLKMMPDSDKLAFVTRGAHVAHAGTVNFKEVWRIDLSKTKDLKRDGSNFFEHAERIK